MEKIETEGFWARFDKALKAKNKNLKGFCREHHFNYQTFINQKSQNSFPNVKTIISISKELDLSLDWLLAGKAIKKTVTYPSWMSPEKARALEVLLSEK